MSQPESPVFDNIEPLRKRRRNVQPDEPSTSGHQEDEPSTSAQPDNRPSTSDNEQYNLEDFIQIGTRRDQYVRRFAITGAAYTLRFRNLHLLPVSIHQLLIDTVNHLIELAVVNPQDADRVGLEIRHQGLSKPILIPFRQHMDAETVIRDIENIATSALAFNLDDKLIIKITHIKIPQGGGRLKLNGNFDDWLAKKSTVIHIPKDGLCLPRALVVGQARLNKEKDPKTWNQVRDKRSLAQKNKATELMTAVGLQDRSDKWSLDHLKLMHATPLLSEYQIDVYSKHHLMSRVYTIGAGPLINLIHHDDHYDVITSMPGFFARGYWCNVCMVPYNDSRCHTICGLKCQCCMMDTPCTPETSRQCEKCNRTFKSTTCFNRHLVVTSHKNSKSTCDVVHKCVDCGTNYNPKTAHQCGHYDCHICKQYVDPDHLCYIQQVESDDKSKPFIFFDMESTQCTELEENHQGKVFEHKVNLVCSSRVCDGCERGNCKDCGIKEFEGINALDEFCSYLFSKPNEGCVAIAHNGKAYDTQFLMQWVINQGATPEVITRGSQIIRMEYSRVVVLDSHCFLTMPLSAFPSALGLEVNNVELAKGYFPHYFNRPENWNAVLDKLPNEKYYGVDSMKTDSLKKFREWYAAHKHDKFDFQKEIKQYCHLDVEILQKGCLHFRKLIKSTHDLDPFTASTTIASLCMRIFRQNFMEENTIGIPPSKGYRSRDTQSALAIKYLRWIEHTKGFQMKHAGNSGEASISTAGHTYKIDGQEVANPQNLWEVNGCLWHGHTCLRRQTILPRSQLTAGQAYERTMKRLEHLQDAGFNVNVRWECEIKAEMRANREMAEYMAEQKKYEPLDPRDAFYGGRTNTRRLYHQISGDEKIHYVDVCSLYPWVLKYGEFPKGHPEVITEKFDDINMRTYRGLIKCLVLPPQHLLHPVLPLKMDSKLLFPLCYECAKLKDNRCEHTPEQRQFWGTWATMELYEAMDQGYKVIEIAEVYHFDEWMEAGDGPFTGYINSFLKTKVEASGYPRGCDTDEQKAQYIADYKAKEDVQLEAANISKNPGLRATAKLCLNSFWGKFGQRETLSKQKFITEPDKFYLMLTDDTIIVEAVDIITDELISVTYKSADEFVEELPSTNVIYASIVTAQARLKLYSYLKEVENNVLYFDTDSVIYLSTPGSPVLPVGEHLGDLTCELDGDFITEFVSCGPKQYAFKTSKGQCVEKIRGFTLTDEASKLLNFNSMKKIVKDYMQSVNTKIDIKFTQIARKQHNVVVTQAAKKTYQFVFDKCFITPDMVCYPYGYIQ